MKSNWKQVKLNDFCDVIMGQSPKSEFYNNVGNGMPFLQGNRTFGAKYPTFDTYTTLTTKTCDANDVIMSVRAPVGDLNITPIKMCLGRGVCALKMKNGNNEFLFYLLKHNVKSLLNRENGTVFGSVNRNDIEKLEVTFTDNVKTQKQIAKILSSIDDKIELNNKINDNLEKQAQAIYCDLFMDIVADTTLSSFVETSSGGTPSRKNDKFYDNGSIHWVKSKELNSSFLTGTEELITQEAMNKSAAKLLPKHSVLIAMYGATVGEYCIISSEMTCNQAICALKPNATYPHTYLYMYVKQHKEEIINLAIGSAQQNISQVLIKQLLIHSDTDTISKFHNLALPLFNKIENNIIENIKLAQLRDTLLPKLMSGEIDVSEVEV